jgi:hypothetical protein
MANCQRFAIGAKSIGLDVEYREGWVESIIPIEHAWLIYEGKVLDLTLGEDREVTYRESTAYGVEEIIGNCVRTGAWCPVDPRKMFEIGPWKKLGEDS